MAEDIETVQIMEKLDGARRLIADTVLNALYASQSMEEQKNAEGSEAAQPQ